MPEFGLLPFARVALEVTNAVLPLYPSRFSKRQITQPKLLGDSLPDALRGLDLPRGRSAGGRNMATCARCWACGVYLSSLRRTATNSHVTGSLCIAR